MAFEITHPTDTISSYDDYEYDYWDHFSDYADYELIYELDRKEQNKEELDYNHACTVWFNPVCYCKENRDALMFRQRCQKLCDRNRKSRVAAKRKAAAKQSHGNVKRQSATLQPRRRHSTDCEIDFVAEPTAATKVNVKGVKNISWM